jgi:hypothetical protein
MRLPRGGGCEPAGRRLGGSPARERHPSRVIRGAQPRRGPPAFGWGGRYRSLQKIPTNRPVSSRRVSASRVTSASPPPPRPSTSSSAASSCSQSGCGRSCPQLGAGVAGAGLLHFTSSDVTGQLLVRPLRARASGRRPRTEQICVERGGRPRQKTAACGIEGRQVGAGTCVIRRPCRKLASHALRLAQHSFLCCSPRARMHRTIAESFREELWRAASMASSPCASGRSIAALIGSFAIIIFLRASTSPW